MGGEDHQHALGDPIATAQVFLPLPIIVEQFCLGVLPSFPVQARDVVVNNIESASGEESEL